MDFFSTDFNLVENIFYFHNYETKSLAFVLNWDTKEKFYFNLLSKSFADVIDTPNDHAMVLTRPEEPNYFHQKIPAFDIRYIEDCFKIKDFPDPTKYLIKNTSHSNYTKDDIFDCWLYQKKKWSDLVSIPESKNNICKIEIDSSFTDSIPQVKRSNNDIDGFGSSNAWIMDTSVKKSNDDVNDVVSSNSAMIATSVKKSNNDIDGFGSSNAWIMDTSVKKSNDDVNDVVSSNSAMIATSVKKSNNDIDGFGSSNAWIMDTSVKKSNDDVNDVVSSNSAMIATSVKKSNDDVYDVVSSNSAMIAKSVKKSNHGVNNVESCNHSKISPSSKKSNHGVNNIMSSNHSKISSSSKKNTKLPYTLKEEKDIVCYIIKNNYALDIKGRAMWQRMESDNVCRHRTWQSMKERYLKHIKFTLNRRNHRFSFITPNEMKLLRQGLNIEPINKDDKEVIKSRFNEERLDNWSSDSS